MSKAIDNASDTRAVDNTGLISTTITQEVPAVVQDTDFDALTTGIITITDSPTDGYVLTSDATGLASWQAPSGGGGITNPLVLNGTTASTSLTHSDAVIPTNYPLVVPGETIAHYEFASDPAKFTDSGPNANTLVLQGSSFPWLANYDDGVIDRTGGVVGGVVVFSNTRSTATITNLSNAVAGDMSLQFWFLTNRTAGTVEIFRIGSPNIQGTIRIFTRGDTGQFQINRFLPDTSQVASRTNTGGFNDGEWHFVAINLGVGLLEVWVDQVLYALDTATATPATTPSDDFFQVQLAASGTEFGAIDNLYLSTAVFVGASTAPDQLTISNRVVAPTLQLTSFPTDGYVLTSDATGVASWQVVDTGIDWTNATDDFKTTGEVECGAFQLTDTPADGYILTSDATGLASWQAPSDPVSYTPDTNLDASIIDPFALFLFDHPNDPGNDLSPTTARWVQNGVVAPDGIGDFSGSTARLTIQSNTAFTTAASGLTYLAIAFRFRVSTTGVNQTILYLQGVGGDDEVLCSVALDNKLTILVRSGGVNRWSWATAGAVTDNTWRHIVIVGGPGGNQFYIDGVLQTPGFDYLYSIGSASSTAIPTALDFGNVGTLVASAYYTGDLDAVMLSSHNYTAGEALALATAVNGGDTLGFETGGRQFLRAVEVSATQTLSTDTDTAVSFDTTLESYGSGFSFNGTRFENTSGETKRYSVRASFHVASSGATNVEYYITPRSVPATTSGVRRNDGIQNCVSVAPPTGDRCSLSGEVVLRDRDYFEVGAYSTAGSTDIGFVGAGRYDIYTTLWVSEC